MPSERPVSNYDHMATEDAAFEVTSEINYAESTLLALVTKGRNLLSATGLHEFVGSKLDSDTSVDEAGLGIITKISEEFPDIERKELVSPETGRFGYIYIWDDGQSAVSITVAPDIGAGIIEVTGSDSKLFGKPVSRTLHGTNEPFLAAVGSAFENPLRTSKLQLFEDAYDVMSSPEASDAV